MDLTNVTISGNSSDNEGGGIRMDGGPVNLTNVTITGNTADATKGAGIHRKGGTVTLKNTIVANSVTGDNCNGTITSAGYNLDSANTCAFSGTGDLINTDPALGPLQDNGGQTFTHELLPGSDAIDAGTNTGCPATDQRGTIRPINGTCDIGSYEGVGLSITKRAFLTDGTAVATGSTTPKGTLIKYLLYINNAGGADTDISVRDILDSVFAYQTGTLKVSNDVANCATATCTSGEEDTIYSNVDGKTASTDAVDGDVVSIAGSTIDAGNENVANAQ